MGNLFLRDAYQCQYCGTRFKAIDLTFDHVQPRSKGGRHNWENVVTACKACNSRKRDYTIDQIRGMGMKMLRNPKKPTVQELNLMASRNPPKQVHPTWSDYLGHHYMQQREGKVE